MNNIGDFRQVWLCAVLTILTIGCRAEAASRAPALELQAASATQPATQTLLPSLPTPTMANPTHPLATLTVAPPAPTRIPFATALPRPSATPPVDWIEWAQAIHHSGENLTVCGLVVSAHFASDSNGQPTFLNIGKAYPDPQRFTVVIWGRNRGSFDPVPEEAYLEQEICVTGEIELYQGIPEIEVKSPMQITFR